MCVPLALSGESVHLLQLVLNGIDQNGLLPVTSSLVPWLPSSSQRHWNLALADSSVSSCLQRIWSSVHKTALQRDLHHRPTQPHWVQGRKEILDAIVLAAFTYLETVIESTTEWEVLGGGSWHESTFPWSCCDLSLGCHALQYLLWGWNGLKKK